MFQEKEKIHYREGMEICQQEIGLIVKTNGKVIR